MTKWAVEKDPSIVAAKPSACDQMQKLPRVHPVHGHTLTRTTVSAGRQQKPKPGTHSKYYDQWVKYG